MQVQSSYRLMFLTGLMILSLAACSSLAASPADSGIEGQATLGPMCPVERVDLPCPDRPYQADLSILTADGRQVVTQIETDPNGYFQVDLAPGRYILHPESPRSGLPYARDIPFSVEAHLFTRLDVPYDSGIR